MGNPSTACVLEALAGRPLLVLVAFVIGLSAGVISTRFMIYSRKRTKSARRRKKKWKRKIRCLVHPSVISEVETRRAELYAKAKQPVSSQSKSLIQFE
jgi:hypothetical protein